MSFNGHFALSINSLPARENCSVINNNRTVCTIHKCGILRREKKIQKKRQHSACCYRAQGRCMRRAYAILYAFRTFVPGSVFRFNATMNGKRQWISWTAFVRYNTAINWKKKRYNAQSKERVNIWRHIQRYTMLPRLILKLIYHHLKFKYTIINSRILKTDIMYLCMNSFSPPFCSEIV